MDKQPIPKEMAVQEKLLKEPVRVFENQSKVKKIDLQTDRVQRSIL